MNIAMNCSTDHMLGRAQYEKTGNNKIDAFYEDLSSASEKSTSHAVGDALALTAIPYNDSLSYGMLAFNSDRSTEEDPIIKISCNYGGQQRYYDVHVNEVNPRNASMSNGFIDLDDSSNYNVKVDWIKMLKEMANEYLKVPETYAQSLAANKLADELMDYIK